MTNKDVTCNILGESSSWLKVKIASHTTNKTDIYGYTDWDMSEFITREGSSNGGDSDSGSGSTTEDIGCKGGTVLPHTVLFKRKPNILKH